MQLIEFNTLFATPATFFSPQKRKKKKKKNEYSHLTSSLRLKCIMHRILVFKNNHHVTVQWQSEVNSVNRDNLRGGKTLFTPLSIISFECSSFFTCYFFGNAPWNNIMKSKIPYTESSSLLTAHSWQVLVFSYIVPIWTLYFMYLKCMSRRFLSNSTSTEKTWMPICLTMYCMNILTPSQHQLLSLFCYKWDHSQDIHYFKCVFQHSPEENKIIC